PLPACSKRQSTAWQRLQPCLASSEALLSPVFSDRTLLTPGATGDSRPSPIQFIEARLRQKFSRLSVPPKSVVKFVESTRTIFPARCPFGGIQSRQLNSLFPAAVNG